MVVLCVAIKKEKIVCKTLSVTSISAMSMKVISFSIDYVNHNSFTVKIQGLF